MEETSMAARALRLIPLRTIQVGFALLAATFASGMAAAAQTYPSRPITLVVPFPPGGSTSIVARIVADKMSETLGQQIVVDNRGGAGGTLGTGPSLYPDAGYDPRKDFAPIGMIGAAPTLLVVYPGFPPHSLKELIAL